MKKLSLTIGLLCIATASLFAQRGKSRNNYSCPKLYIGVSTGLENPSGVVGFNIDVPLTQNFSLGTGAGLSTWGYKAYGEGRFYFGECNRGWAIGTGVTYNTGLTDFTTQLPTTVGTQDVTVDLKPKVNVFLGAYRFWNLGHRGNRLYLSLGYSMRLDEDNYAIKDPFVTLTSEGKQAMRILAPGGIMLGFGFSFGVVR